MIRFCRCWRLAETSGGGFTDGIGTPILLWDVANNRSAGTLTSPNIVTNLAFSGDGTKLRAPTAPTATA